MKFASQRLSRHKRITGGIVFVDIVPKNPSGKILRRQLRERAKGGLDVVWANNVDVEMGRVKTKL